MMIVYILHFVFLVVSAQPTQVPYLISATMNNFCIQNSIPYINCVGASITSTQRILSQISEMRILRLSNYLLSTDVSCASITATFTDYLQRQLFTTALYFNDTHCSVSWPEANLRSPGVVIFRLLSSSIVTQVYDMDSTFGTSSLSAYTAFHFNVDKDNIIRLMMSPNKCTTEPLSVRFVMSNSCSVFALRISTLSYRASMPDCVLNYNYVRATFILDEICQPKTSVDIFGNAIVLPIGQNPIFKDNLIYLSNPQTSSPTITG